MLAGRRAPPSEATFRTRSALVRAVAFRVAALGAVLALLLVSSRLFLSRQIAAQEATLLTAARR
jgi:hypothetical protein